MPAHASRRIVFDSDSEREDEEAMTSTSELNHAATTESRPHRDGNPQELSASDSELSATRPKVKRGRKPKPKLPSAPAVDEDRSKPKRFEWSNYPTEAAFLQKEFDDVLATADSKQCRHKKAALKTQFLDKFGVLGEYSKEEFDAVSLLITTTRRRPLT